METATDQRTVVRCDDCHAEFELFSKLANATTCRDGRPHRSVRIRRTS